VAFLEFRKCHAVTIAAQRIISLLRQTHLPSAAENQFEAGESVSKLPSIDDLLNKAFRLAWFIHGDRKTAINIVAKAMIKLEVAAASQHKRLYYKPIGRSWPERSKSEGFRNRVCFNDLHLLQRLIYIESEPYEIQKERGHNAVARAEKDLVIHFIKHLVRITIKRNSFYVTLGLSRLLYHYTTAETMEIYSAVIQDPDRVKDDYYYRSRKGVLMQEMKERFGDLLKIRRVGHGEERFETDENPGRFVEAVEECLSAFTPWWTNCVVPGTDPLMDGIPELSYQGHRKEDEIEVNRMHAVLHPLCLRRLIRALGFESPVRSLAIPSFFFSISSNDDAGNGGLRHPAELDNDELLSLKRDLDEQSQRRKSASTGLLRILVDGVERGHLDLTRAASVDFNLERDAELIEIRANDKVGDEVLLATHLIAHGAEEEETREQHGSIILERGQELSINISRTAKAADSVVRVNYRETNSLRSASLYFSQRVQGLREGKFVPLFGRAHPVLTTTLACILVTIFVVAGTRYVKRETSSKVSPYHTDTQSAGPSVEAQSSGAQTTTQNNVNVARSEASTIQARQKSPLSTTVEKDKEKQSVVVNPLPAGHEGVTTSEKTGSEAELTRSLGPNSTAVSLSNVRKIYITFLGNLPVNEPLRDKLFENLRASNRFALAQNRDEADALMKVSSRKSVDKQPETASVFVQLINARGEIIWPTPRTSSGGNYQGSVATMSRRIVEDLLEEIRSLKPAKK
jgi:hypothetical protein